MKMAVHMVSAAERTSRSGRGSHTDDQVRHIERAQPSKLLVRVVGPTQHLHQTRQGGNSSLETEDEQIHPEQQMIYGRLSVTLTLT